MPICLRACVRLFRHARLPSYVPACLGSCLSVCMNGSTRAEINTINGLFAFVSVSYHSQNENMSGLKSACSNQIRQRKCSVFVCFRVSLCHSTLCAYTDVEHVHFRRVVPAFGTVFIGTVSVAWIKLAGQLAADGVASVWTLWVQIPAGSATIWVIGRFPQPEKKQYEYLCMYACVRVCVHAYTHACMSVSMHVTHASTVVLSNIYGEANNI